MLSRILARAPLDARSLPGQLLLVATLVGLALLSWWKGINFDESLALHSGWLALEHSDASPVLWSPWTLALGILAHAFADPGVVLHLGRALALIWILSGVWASTRGRDPSYPALALLLACSFDEGIAHLVEFRYDASLIGASLWYWARLRDVERPLSFGAGLWLGLLATHQLKGLALAALLLVFSALSRPNLAQLRAVLAGAAALVTAWGLASWAMGQGARIGEGYALFFELARVHPAPAPLLHGSAAALLLFGLVSIGLPLWRARAALRAGLPLLSACQQQLAQHAGWLAFSALALAHPQLFAYHLAPIELGLSLVVAGEVERLFPVRVLQLALAVPLFSWALAGTANVGSVPAITRVTSTPLHRAITTLRAVRAAEQPGDRALDPSGTLYFLPPCGREWYVDALFAEWVKQGRWMYSPLSPPCTWVLRTHRLAALPPQQLAGLGAFQLQPGTGGLLTSEAAQRHIEPQGLGDSTPSAW